jgi:hypothetical protein
MTNTTQPVSLKAGDLFRIAGRPEKVYVVGALPTQQWIQARPAGVLLGGPDARRAEVQRLAALPVYALGTLVEILGVRYTLEAGEYGQVALQTA